MDLHQPIDQDVTHATRDLTFSVQVASRYLHLVLQGPHVQVDLLGILAAKLGVISVVLVDVFHLQLQIVNINTNTN